MISILKLLLHTILKSSIICTKGRRSPKTLLSFAMGLNRKSYTSRISRLINTGFKNVIPILDNKEELDRYKRGVRVPFKLGIRVAAEEEPNFPFYTSRLGIRAKDILEFLCRPD